MTEEQRLVVSKQGDLRLADLPNDVLADAARWRIDTVLEQGFSTGDDMLLLPLCLVGAVVGALVTIAPTMLSWLRNKRGSYLNPLFERE
jgi:hypothetical protein